MRVRARAAMVMATAALLGSGTAYAADLPRGPVTADTVASAQAESTTAQTASTNAAREAAEAGVAQFHRMIEAGRYREIYVEAADEFRRATTEEDGIRFLQMVHDRLGAVRSTSSTGWRVNFTPGGSTFSLTYNTQFASGAGTEDFVFRIGGASARLAGYHVNSPALIGQDAPTAPAAAAKPAEAGEAAAPAPVVAPPSVGPPKPPEPPPPGGK